LDDQIGDAVVIMALVVLMTSAGEPLRLIPE